MRNEVRWQLTSIDDPERVRKSNDCLTILGTKLLYRAMDTRSKAVKPVTTKMVRFLKNAEGKPLIQA